MGDWTVMDIIAGRLQDGDILHHDSPHCDDRPDPDDVGLLVVHNISLPPGCFGRPHIEALFLGALDSQAHQAFSSLEGLRVSAHVLIRRDGTVVQFVPFHRRAWHAGVSSYQGRNACNDFSIGIELEGTDTWVFTYAQYAKLAAVTAALCCHYPRLTLDNIVGHSEIAPGRKSDPGSAFDWDYFRQLLT